VFCSIIGRPLQSPRSRGLKWRIVGAASPSPYPRSSTANCARTAAPRTRRGTPTTVTWDPSVSPQGRGRTTPPAPRSCAHDNETKAGHRRAAPSGGGSDAEEEEGEDVAEEAPAGPERKRGRGVERRGGVERAHVDGGDGQPVEVGRGEPRVGDEVAVGGAKGDGGNGEERSEREQQQQRVEATVAARPPHGSSALWVGGRWQGRRRTRGKFCASLRLVLERKMEGLSVLLCVRPFRVYVIAGSYVHSKTLVFPWGDEQQYQTVRFYEVQ
jgi:hypothetical protein